MPAPDAIYAWLHESEIVNGITTHGFKLDLDRELRTPSVLGERRAHTSCSGRTSSALRAPRSSQGWTPDGKRSVSSRQTRLPQTPEGSARSCSCTGPSPGNARNALSGALATAPKPGFFEGRLCQPVLLARAVEDCMSSPGAPPRRASGLRRLRASVAQQEEPHEFDLNGLPQSSRSKSSTCRVKATKTRAWLAEDIRNEMGTPSQEEISAEGRPRTCTPPAMRETIHPRQATKDCNRANAVKWAAMHHRKQQVFQLRYLISNPEVRDIFTPEGSGGGDGGRSTPTQLTYQELNDLAQVPKNIEMPATVHSVDNALFMDEEEQEKATKLKKKQNLQVRLRALKRVAKERRLKEAEAHRIQAAADTDQDTGQVQSASVETAAANDTKKKLIVETTVAQDPEKKVSVDLAQRLSQRLNSTPTSPRNSEMPQAISASPKFKASSIFGRRLGQDRSPPILRVDSTSLNEKSDELQDGNGDSPGSPLSPNSPISLRHKRQQEMSDKMGAIREKAFKDQAAHHHERELHVLQEAFNAHDIDQNHALDHGEIRHCLATLGVQGRNEPERQEIRQILWKMDKLLFDFKDLSEFILPEVRAGLKNMRQPRFLELFASVDRQGRCALSIEETLDALRRLGMIIREDIRDRVVHTFMYEAHHEWVHSTSEPILGPPEFVSFVSILVEQTDRDKAELFRTISGKYGFSSEMEKAWQHDLVDFYCQFHEYDPASAKYGSSTGRLEEQQFMAVVRESGYMPKTRARQTGLTHSFQDLQRGDHTIGFDAFLSIMQKLRDHDRERLWRVLETRLRDGLITHAELFDVLPDCGITCRNVDEEHEVRAMMEEHDVDGLGVYSGEECVPLLQVMSRKMRMIQHECERQYVMSAGWSIQHFVEFRHAFQHFDEDMSEYLDCDELMKAVELLRGSYWQSQQNIDLMFVALGIDTSQEIKVNFLTFLRMMKMLDESETRRQQGAIMGFSRDKTDMLYSIFQALEPERDGTLSRRLLEQVIVGLSGSLTQTQLQDIMRMLSQDPQHIEFRSFLRVMKSLDGVMDVDLDVLQQGWKKGQRRTLRMTDLTAEGGLSESRNDASRSNSPIP